MVKRLAMFPGQGSQSVGMARELLQEFPKTKLVFEEVEDTLNAVVAIVGVGTSLWPNSGTKSSTPLSHH